MTPSAWNSLHRSRCGADVAAVLALEQLGRVAGVFDVLDAALQFAVRVVQHLAVLGGDERGDLVGVFFQQHLQLALITRALERRRVAPGRKAFSARQWASTVAGPASATLVDEVPVAGLNTGCTRPLLGNDLAVDQVADGGGDVLVVFHGDFK